MREAIFNETVLKDVALQIVQQGLLSNWRFYAILLALSLVSGAIGAYLSKYFGKRGETAATKTDFDEIIRQLAKTTEVAEQVRSAVSYADWTAREWKTIRRIKLEELVQSAINVKHWAEQQCAAWRENFFSDQAENKKTRELACPAEQVAMISTLYFPSLQKESEKLYQVSCKAIVWLANKTHEINNAVSLQESISAIETNRCELWMQKETVAEWEEHYRDVLGAIKELKEKAAEIMRDMQTI